MMLSMYFYWIWKVQGFNQVYEPINVMVTFDVALGVWEETFLCIYKYRYTWTVNDRFIWIRRAKQSTSPTSVAMYYVNNLTTEHVFVCIPDLHCYLYGVRDYKTAGKHKFCNCEMFCRHMDLKTRKLERLKFTPM